MKKVNKDKFSYKKGDLKYTAPVKEHAFRSFSRFVVEKEVDFDEATMRWITIHDEAGRQQHVLISKEDGTILGGMGGKHNGKKLKDVFAAFEEKRTSFDAKTALRGEAIHYECSLEEKVNLSQQEKRAVFDYSGNMYEDVNSFLRNYIDDEEEEEDPLYGYSGMTVSELQEYADTLSGALKKFRTPKSIVTYRGVNEDYVSMIEDEFVVGGKLYDYGFASTSSDESVARKFVGDGYMMEVHIPKGSRAASIDSLSNFAGFEKEVLVDRQACFTIKEINKKNRRLIVELSHDEED